MLLENIINCVSGNEKEKTDSGGGGVDLQSQQDNECHHDRHCRGELMLDTLGEDSDSSQDQQDGRSNAYSTAPISTMSSVDDSYLQNVVSLTPENVQHQ